VSRPSDPLEERARERARQWAPVAPSYVDQTSLPDYDALQDAAITRLKGGKSFAGQAEDPFFLDVGVFDLLSGVYCRCSIESRRAPLAMRHTRVSWRLYRSYVICCDSLDSAPRD
jgi:Domain of unknown function (DUF4331)